MKLSAWIFVAVAAALTLLVGCEVSDEPVQSKPAAPATTSPDEGGQFQLPATASPTPPAQPTKALARGKLRFIEGYRQGYEAAVREGKPMLLFFTAEWCHYCHQMADEALSDGRVVSLSERFVCVLVDADVEKEVCRQFRVTGFPTVQFIAPSGALLNRVKAKVPAHQLVGEMHSALQAVARAESGGAWAR